MNRKITTLLNKIHPILWHLICFGFAIMMCSLILGNPSPNFIRPVSMALRTGFGLVIPLTTILLFLSMHLPNRIGQFVSSAFVLSLFAMPLAGLWASGQTQSTVLNGLIPLYDAEAYYIDALKLLSGIKFSIFSARRPLFPGLLAVLLSWTGYNLMATLALLTIIVGFACYFATKEIQRTHGAEVATFILIILFLFFRAHSGISMSENLGVALGVLGFALLWQGASGKNILSLWSGLFVTTLALNARAGAFFMLPVLILWVGWLFKGDRIMAWKPMLLVSTAVVLGFALNLMMTRIIAIPSGVPFANFSYTLYGLASGGNSWVYVFEAHPEILTIREPEKTKKIYELAFELIRTKPWLTIQGALFNWKMLFSDSWYNIYAYVGGETWWINVVARWLMYILGLVGIYTCIQDKNDAVKSLVIVSFLGVFISVPFLPPTDAYRMRPYAASIIILTALPAMGLSFILSKLRIKFLSKNNVLEKPSTIPLVFSLLLITITLIFPIFLHKKSMPVLLQPISCANDSSEFILVRFDPGSYINIKKQNLQFLDGMPNYHVGQFKRNAHSLADENLIRWTGSLQPPITIFYTLDFSKSRKVLVAFETEKAPETGKYYQLCGNFETETSLTPHLIFYAEEALLLSP